MRTAIYVRCSTEHQDTDMQLEALGQYCRMHGIDDFDVYEDYYSGTKLQRPKFQELLGRCERGEYARLVVYKFDRISRNMRDFLNIMHDMDEWGVSVVSIKDQVDMGTVMGKAMMKMMMIVSELEVEFMRERTRDGIKAARARGAKLGAPVVHDIDLDEIRERKADGESVRLLAYEYGLSVSQLYRRLAAA